MNKLGDILTFFCHALKSMTFRLQDIRCSTSEIYIIDSLEAGNESSFE